MAREIREASIRRSFEDNSYMTTTTRRLAGLCPQSPITIAMKSPGPRREILGVAYVVYQGRTMLSWSRGDPLEDTQLRAVILTVIRLTAPVLWMKPTPGLHRCLLFPLQNRQRPGSSSWVRASMLRPRNLRVSGLTNFRPFGYFEEWPRRSAPR